MPAVISAAARPRTVAAPPMSFFMISIAFDALQIQPAQIKADALADQGDRRPAVAPAHVDQPWPTSAARPTVLIAGKSFSSAAPLVTSIAAPDRPARSRAAASMPAGVMWLAGALIRSRHSAVPVARPVIRLRSVSVSDDGKTRCRVSAASPGR